MAESMIDTSSKVERLLKRFKKAKSNSDIWQSHWDNAYSLIFPDRNLYKRETSGAYKGLRSYDNTAQNAANHFVSQMHLALTPLFTQWAVLVPGDNVPEGEEPQVRRLLQKATDIMFNFIDNSNFSLVVNEAYHDLVIGTAAFLCLEGETDEDPLIFRYVPLQDISIEETQQSELHNVWRMFKKVPIIDIQQLWPKAKLTEKLKDLVNRDPNACIDLVEGTVYDSKKKTFTYYVIDKRNREILMESEDKSSPWIVFRWDKARGEVFGRGPGVNALGAINSLNMMAEMSLSSADLKAHPIYLGFDDSVFNPWTVKIRPKTIIPIAPTAGTSGLPIQPLPESGDVNFGQLVMQDLRDQINKLFFTDPLMASDERAQPLSATEINLRNQQNLEAKAPSFGRLEVELTSKLVKRVVFILRKKGLMPNIEVNNKAVAIEYRSELAKLKGLRDVNALTQAAQTLQSILGPQLSVGAYNIEMLPEMINENLGVDLKVVKTPQQIAAQMQQAAQAAQQQQAQLPGAPTGGIQPPQGQPQQQELPLGG